MTDITIPPEAIEAAAIELAPALWSMYTEDAREHFRRKARAACLAMLKAWPGMFTYKYHERSQPPSQHDTTTALILPLPK